LPAPGSVADRVMREVVFRERREKVAHVEVIAKVVGRLFNLDTERVFGGIMAEYAGEVFQEDYDVDLLREKIHVLREAQARIKRRRSEDQRQLSRLDRLGEFYDREFGADLKPIKK
jgi:hypothetical protein